MENIHFAAEKGNVKVLKRMIEENQSNINDVDEAGFTPLIWAARNGHTRCVKIILNATGVDINKTDNQGNTALHWAAKNGHTSCVRLLQNKTDIELAVNHAKLSPIHTALLHGHIKCAKLLQPQKTKNSLLLRFSALTITSALIICIFAFTLCIAYQKARINAEAHLLNKIKEHHESIKTNAIGALDRIQIRKDQYEQQLFLVCKENGHENLQKLIEAGADVNIKNKDGKTPLHIAIENKHCDCVKILLASQKINLNATDNERKTPLHYAVEKNDIASLRLLIHCTGVDFCALDDQGFAPIHKAVLSKDCSPACLTELAEYAHNLHIKDKDGWTALSLAEKYKKEYADILKGIKETQASRTIAKLSEMLNNRDKNGIYSYLFGTLEENDIEAFRLFSLIDPYYEFSPVECACEKGLFDCLKVLLETPGVKFNVCDALYLAASGGHADCVRLLLTMPDTDFGHEEYCLCETPLTAAARNGHDECVKILLADPRIPVNKTWDTSRCPLHEAIRNDHFSCAALIIAAGGKL